MVSRMMMWDEYRLSERRWKMIKVGILILLIQVTGNLSWGQWYRAPERLGNLQDIQLLRRKKEDKKRFFSCKGTSPNCSFQMLYKLSWVLCLMMFDAYPAYAGWIFKPLKVLEACGDQKDEVCFWMVIGMYYVHLFSILFGTTILICFFF